MLKFCFGLFVLIGAVTFAAIQLADNPGRISIDWLGYHPAGFSTAAPRAAGTRG